MARVALRSNDVLLERQASIAQVKALRARSNADQFMRLVKAGLGALIRDRDRFAVR